MNDYQYHNSFRKKKHIYKVQLWWSRGYIRNNIAKEIEDFKIANNDFMMVAVLKNFLICVMMCI